MTNVIEQKFSGCSECLFFRSRQCRTCDAGEHFTEREDELDLQDRYPKRADLRRLDPNQIDAGADDE